MMDRFTRGLVAGMVGGVVMNAWDLTSYHLLHFSKQRYLDWASVLIYGNLAKDFPGVTFALISHLFWVGFLGVIFAFLIPHITSGKYLLKGGTFGFIAGFFIYAIGIAFKMPVIINRTTGTAISQFLGGTIWGIVLAATLQWLDTRVEAVKPERKGMPVKYRLLTVPAKKIKNFSRKKV